MIHKRPPIRRPSTDMLATLMARVFSRTTPMSEPTHVCTICHSPTRPRRRWGAAAGLGLLLLLPVLGFSAIIFMHIPKTGGPIFNYNGEAYVSDLYLDTALYWAGVVLFVHLLRSDTRCRSCGSKATVPFSTRMGQAIERRYPSGVPQPRKETSP